MRAFTGLGFREEAASFLQWLLHATRLTWPKLQVLYDVYGQTDLREEELSHLAGYRGSRPVRIGNGAHDQVQLDVYGNIVVAAVRAGSGMRIQARDQAGGRFTDRYLLDGAPTAVDAAAARCAGKMARK